MRFLIVEDDQKIADFIRDSLRQEGHEAVTAADGESALVRATEGPTAFDALVLDVLLPRLDGFGVLHSLREHGVGSPVLMLSARDSVDDRVRGLRAGADDYLIKPFAFDELAARLFALTRRVRTENHRAEATTVPTHLTLADLTMDRLNRQVRRAGRTIELQPKEFALLECFLKNVGRPLTRTLILERVWQWTFDPQTNVVDVLVMRLRGKIEEPGEAKLIHTIRGIGYVLRAP